MNRTREPEDDVCSEHTFFYQEPVRRLHSVPWPIRDIACSASERAGEAPRVESEPGLVSSVAGPGQRESGGWCIARPRGTGFKRGFERQGCECIDWSGGEAGCAGECASMEMLMESVYAIVELLTSLSMRLCVRLSSVSRRTPSPRGQVRFGSSLVGTICLHRSEALIPTTAHFYFRCPVHWFCWNCNRQSFNLDSPSSHPTPTSRPLVVAQPCAALVTPYDSRQSAAVAMPSLSPQVQKQPTRKQSSSSLLTPTTPGSAPGWKSIFRMPSLKKLNHGAHLLTVNDDRPLSYSSSHTVESSLEVPQVTNNNISANRSSYTSSQSTDSDPQRQLPQLSYPAPLPSESPVPSPTVQFPRTSVNGSPEQPPPKLLPRKEKTRSFLGRKLSFSIKPISPSQHHHQRPVVASQGIAKPPVRIGTTGMPSSQKPSTKASAARFLRRVASAPNAKGILSSPSAGHPPSVKNGLLTPVEPVPPLPGSPNGEQGTNSLETASSKSSAPALAMAPQKSGSGTRQHRALTASSVQKHRDAVAGLGEPPGRAAFRRTYSSNSIKVRSVEVRPSSFQKVKMLGRGDVGKVYLVREKKTDKLFAMKGKLLVSWLLTLRIDVHPHSALEEGDDCAEQDQAGPRRTGNPRHC